jgi:hypothetical protein
VSDVYAPEVCDVLTTLQGFAMETVADRSSEAALDSPINMGGETGTRLLKDQVKVPEPLEDAVPESAGEVVSPSGSVEEAPTGPNTQLGSLQPAAVVNKHRGRRLAVRRIFSDYNRPWGVVLLRRLVAVVLGGLVHPQRRQDPMRRLGRVDESTTLT